MKRFLTLLAFVAISICSYAYDFEEGGIYYNITSSMTVSVTYKNTNYNSYSGIVVIPSDVTHNGSTYSVTSIGKSAFHSCEELSYVSIPNSITSIAESAFRTSGLTSVTIPNSVTGIGEWAFAYCSGLTSVTIPNSVTSIAKSAFNHCSSLTSVTIPNSVTSIGDAAFEVCSGLTSITIPNSVTSIGDYAFSQCSQLTSINIPNNVTWIGGFAFAWCSNLTSVSIPNLVKHINYGTFYHCSNLTSVTIPNSVTKIDYGNAFEGCNKVKELIYAEGCSIALRTGLTSITSVTIPNSVTSIENSAFDNCSKLSSITIPNSVTSIGKTAFDGCSGLMSITVEDGNPNYDSRDNCNALIETNTNILIKGCANTSIPNSVTSIENSAFYNCSSLTSITIPNSVTSIGKYAFSGCSRLASVTNRAPKPQSINEGTFSRYGTLHVLKGYKDVYSNSDYWKKFTIVDDLDNVLVKGFIIDVDNQHFDINVGGLRAKATPTNEDADDWSVTWSTTTPSIMIVVPTTGDFMGLTDGVGELVATANDGSGVVAKAKVYFGTAQPDAIEFISVQDNKNDKVYNLNGTRVNGDNLPAGVYIKNGKKVIVK